MIARLPLPSKRHNGTVAVLRAADHFDVLRYVNNRRSIPLDTVQVLEHEKGETLELLKVQRTR